jgi:phenylpropionate dioxygenase-like ring-hydroxylating dioxygenase large terminal subunit
MMQDDQLNLIHRSMDAQLGRTEYPEGFPALPEVPAARYYDEGFAALEREHLWLKSWLMVGHQSEFSEPGSYRLFEKLGRSVIVSRAKDGVIRAFHNTCRHRASALLLEPQGKTMRFVCPYHAWGYSLEGQLVSVPDAHDFACLDKSSKSLVPVRCEIWRGMIFLNFDEHAEPLADHMAPMTAQTEGFPLERLVVKDRITVPMDCNWKAAYDNFLEIYHVNVVHAKSIAPYLNSPSFIVSLLKNGHARFATRKRKGDTIFAPPVTMPDDIAPLFKECTIALPTFPNSFYALDPVGFNYQTFWPDGAGRSIMEATMFGWESDSPEDKEYWAKMRPTVESILSEDLRLFHSMQRSLESGVMPSIVMGYQERALYWFQEEIDRRIGPDRIPAHMRVTPVLAGQMAG